MTTTTMPRPDAVYVWRGLAEAPLAATPDLSGTWSTSIGDVLLAESAGGLHIRLAANSATGISQLALRWNHGVAEDALILGDAWERSYGDLHWEHVRPERVLPWYWLSTTTAGAAAGTGGGAVEMSTRGAGVRVRPGAWCSWTVDADGITLWCDVRSGNDPVMLGTRILDVATVVALETPPGVSAFAAHQELCAAMCSDPLRMDEPLVGCNNWYYAYGENFDADAVVRDAAMISRISGDHVVRPFCVIDAGWGVDGGVSGGPWDAGFASFSDMSAVADRIHSENARAGLWYRPLMSRVPVPGANLLDGVDWALDPSLDATLERVAADVTRFREWGYQLVKHDFSTYDILGRFLPGNTAAMTDVPWTFADRSRTTAEVIVGFYRAVHSAAGEMIVIGCNTVGHLAAGLVQAQRIGDDTSGRQWERTRRMGVNTLAFRLAQHRAFFAADADCVAATPTTPWNKNSQFLDLIAQSGTALFVSIDPRSHDSTVETDLRRAIRLALDGGAAGGIEPLDWQRTSAPKRWRIGDETRTFAWNTPWGVDLGLASI